MANEWKDTPTRSSLRASFSAIYIEQLADTLVKTLDDVIVEIPWYTQYYSYFRTCLRLCIVGDVEGIRCSAEYYNNLAHGLDQAYEPEPMGEVLLRARRNVGPLLPQNYEARLMAHHFTKTIGDYAMMTSMIDGRSGKGSSRTCLGNWRHVIRMAEIADMIAGHNT